MIPLETRTPAAANNGLVELMQLHLTMIQDGKFGVPTMEDLQFCGKLHTFLESLADG